MPVYEPSLVSVVVTYILAVAGMAAAAWFLWDLWDTHGRELMRRARWWWLGRRFHGDMRGGRLRRSGRDDGLREAASRWAHPTAPKPPPEPAVLPKRVDPPKPDMECRACGDRLIWHRGAWVHVDGEAAHHPTPGEPWVF